MKKILIFIFSIVVILSLASCSPIRDTEKAGTISDAESGALNSEDTILIEQGGFSYEIPGDWHKVDDLSTDQVWFFKSSLKDIEDMPSNVTVEMNRTGREAPPFEALAEENIFNETMVLGIATRAEDVKIGENFFVPIGGVFQASYYYTLQDGNRVMQRMFLPVVNNYAVLVYATDFRDDTSPLPEDVAKMILNTMEYN